jgi:MFS family permease
MTLLYAFHYGLPLYASSTYLGLTFKSSNVSLIYAVSSFITLLVSLHIAKYIRRFHTYRFTQAVVIAEILVTLGLALTHSAFFIALFFITHFVLTILIYISLNTFVEAFSPHHEVGMIRGMFLTVLNLGILISPFFGGEILARGGYQTLYIVAACVLIPFIFFLHRFMHQIPDPHYTKVEIFEAFNRARKDRDLGPILLALFILECFYGVMTIYSPLYLVSIGIPLPVYLTAILPVALLPLVILPYELGILADTKLGEKELLISGLLLMAIMTMVMALVTSSSILLWIVILTLSRVGASLVETMTFSYYFKKIGSKDIGLISVFTNIRSIAIIVVPLVGILISPLVVTYPGLMFVLLSIMLLYAALRTVPVHDTK